MSSKIFDIPFRIRSSKSDFSCKDGEIAVAENVEVPGFISGLTEVPPPSAEIDFGIVRTVLPGWHIHPDVFPAVTLLGGEITPEYINRLASGVLYQFQKDADLHNLFVSPFFAVAVWKTVDGDYISPSAVKLLIPNSKVPLITSDGYMGASDITFKVAAAVTQLYFKVHAPEILREYVGKIESLVILISEPLHSYSNFYNFLPITHAESDAFCESLDPATGEVIRTTVCTETLSPAWRGITQGVSSFDNALPSEKLKFYPFYQIPLRDIDLASEWQPCDSSGIGIEPAGRYESVGYNKIITTATDKNSSEEVIVRGKGLNIKLQTRPIKLTGAGELKKMRRLSLRGNYLGSKLTISVEGSRDMLNWWKISEKEHVTTVGLPPSYFRFYRLQVRGVLNVGDDLQGFSMSGNL